MYEAHMTLGLLHVANARARVGRRIALIRRLQAHELDCALALEVLRLLRQSLAVDWTRLALFEKLCLRS